MNISFFEILIFIFIVYPIIKRVLENLAGKQNVPERSEQKRRPQATQTPETAESDPWTEQPVDWDEAFKELEELFTGKKPEPESQIREMPEPEVHITAEPVRNPDVIQRDASFERLRYVQERPQTNQENPYQDLDYDAIGLDVEPADLVDDDNPIFQDVDEMTTVTVYDSRGINVSSDLKDPEIMRNAIIIKEVLDAPLSIRKSAFRGHLSQLR